MRKLKPVFQFPPLLPLPPNIKCYESAGEGAFPLPTPSSRYSLDDTIDRKNSKKPVLKLAHYTPMPDFIVTSLAR